MRLVLTLGLALFASSGAAARSAGFFELCKAELGLTAAQCQSVAGLHLNTEKMRPPTQPEASRIEAAALGYTLFFDLSSSRNGGGGVSCVRCHVPEQAFSERKARSAGFSEVTRNAPTLFNAAYKHRLFWDGRANSLAEQPLITMETPEEMDLTRLEIAHQIAKLYADRYSAIFGPLPDLSDAKRFPPRGKPGDAAFDGMTPADQKTVNQIAHNISVCFEAYMRKLAAGPAPFDFYLEGESETISAAAKKGLTRFVQRGCIDCHSGPLLSDEKPHDLKAPLVGGVPKDQSTVLTPPLRNIVLSAPYGHNGVFATLPEVIAHHDRVLNGSAPRASDTEDLIQFLKTLTGRRPEMPWSGWRAR